MKNFLKYFLMFAFMAITYDAFASGDEELRRNKYKTGLLGLGTGYKSKLFCSCHFQMKLGYHYCSKFVSVSPEVFNIEVNDKKKHVEAKALGLFRYSKASFVNDELGCVLD